MLHAERRLGLMPVVSRFTLSFTGFFALVWLVPLALPAEQSVIWGIQGFFFTVVAVLAVGSCLTAARITLRHERLAWTLLAAGTAMMLAGDLLSAATGGVLRQPTSSGPSGPGFLWVAAFIPYILAFALFLQTGRRAFAHRVRRAFELAMLVLLVTLVLYAGVLFPLYGSGPGRSLMTTLPFFVSLAVCVSLLLHIASSRPRLRQWHQPLLGALVVVCAGSIVDVTIAIRGAVAGMWGGGLGLPWFVGYVLVAAAGLERSRLRESAPRNVSISLHATGPAWGTALSAVFFVLLPVFVHLDDIWQGDPMGDLSFSLLISAGGVCAIARNLVIAAENSSLRRHATTDPLTGLFNHRHFHERLDAEVRRASRSRSSLSVVTMDVDLFDRVNNVYGHGAGDLRLRSIAERLTAASRTTDIVCRVGGDEFSIIMPDTDPIDAYRVCLRLQDYLREPDDVCPLPTGMSMGIASLPEHADTKDQLSKHSDEALYWAKFHGRGQIVIFDPAIAQELAPEERLARLEQESYVNMVQLLSSAVDARDPYTHHHSRRVAELAVAFARDLGFNEHVVASLETASLLHDVGKIGVPDEILGKSAQLTGEERSLIRDHPALAGRILAAIPRKEILPWIESHHERWDGAGYPHGLAGEQIPLESRLIALCDAMDAMTSDRPYRPGLSVEEACDEICACAGKQFDPYLAQRFVKLMRSQRAQAVTP